VKSSGSLWKIPTENFIGDSLCNWHDEQCSQFTNKFTDGITDGIYSVGKSVGKNDMSSFFLLCFNFFSHGNSLGIYRGNIFVGKIPRKFTDENISSVSVCIYQFSGSEEKGIKKGIILYWLISESTLNIEKEWNQRKKNQWKIQKKKDLASISFKASLYTYLSRRIIL